MTASRPPLGERVASLETAVFDLKETVKDGFDGLSAEIKKQSLNGRTANAKALVDDVGDPESRAALRAIVRGRSARTMLTRPAVVVGLAIAGPAAGFLLGKLFP
jgi:hypothetical protein